jgi:hypothetical protein
MCRKCEGLAGGVHMTFKKRDCICMCEETTIDKIYGQIVCSTCGHSLGMPHR